MKNLNILLAGFLILALISCKEEAETPKVTYEKTSTEVAKPQPIDSSQIEIADLPIQMEGTRYLIHPIGDYRVYEGRAKSSYGSSNTDKVSFSISNYNRFEITGFLQNLKFQHIDSTEIRPLTDKKMVIQTASYLNTIFEKTKHQLLVYSVADMDTNKDNKLDVSDIKSLYISDISGKDFTKLSPDMQELIDWNLVESKNRLYFRTIEDTNKNGQFDKNDVILYYYVDLSNKDWKLESYKPV
ncbi:MAG: hypothetical protein EOO46_04960 [Flavobacterium sp.]|nr:MAG: hypothetical protein EOO46_04960 [Flavobacterium sp.]